jgi:hypothetical protein
VAGTTGARHGAIRNPQHSRAPSAGAAPAAARRRAREREVEGLITA